MAQHIHRSRLSDLRVLGAFGFGAGLSPVAPGTVGTLAAVPIYLLLAKLPTPLYATLLILAFATGIWLCGAASKTLAVHDHPGIVYDEMVGYWATMFLIPPGTWTVLAGFVLFRLFDIWKPWPIGGIDRRVSGGFGIMLDDLLAAVYANLSLQLLVWGVAH